MDQHPDLEQRDPNDLNGHIKVQYEDVIGEPEGVRSIDCIWVNSYKCFECGKSLCYKLLTTLCGLCIALYWGCDFAATSFNHIWLYTPCMRDFAICVGCCQKIFAVTIGCCLTPICQSCGMCLSQISVNLKKG